MSFMLAPCLFQQLMCKRNIGNGAEAVLIDKISYITKKIITISTINVFNIDRLHQNIMNHVVAIVHQGSKLHIGTSPSS